MPIRLLEPHTASQIAAGEVVDDPSSIVKELVENALDAEATMITIETVRGGSELVRVTDNGCGIPSDEVELAFQRHATSKIRIAEDIPNIQTLGFRGEALPSIAAVAHVVMITRIAHDIAGVRLESREGEITAHQPQGTAQGTSVGVYNLFQNVPARLKYLKSTASQTARIHHLIAHFVLAHPEVRFAWIRDARPALLSPGEGSLETAAASIYGVEAARQLLRVDSDHDNNLYRVTGLTSPASMTRANRMGIRFFVNRRWIQSRLLSYAVEEAYRGFLMQRRYPLAALNLLVPLIEIDVNVHPAKTEIRFLREGDAFSAIQRAVREALVTASPIPDVRIGNDCETSRPRMLWPMESSYSKGEAQTFRSETSEPQTMQDLKMPLLRTIGQVAQTYIVAEGMDGIFLIDQHAAHERVLYENVLSHLHIGKPPVQGLLPPVALEMGATHTKLALEHREELYAYGFQIDPFGNDTCLLRTVPAMSADAAPEKLLGELVELLAEGLSPTQTQHGLAASIACHSAVRAGMSLDIKEMTGLVRSLEEVENPYTCPHGRPSTVHLGSNFLDQQFGRR